jgi:hypothetical protein
MVRASTPLILRFKGLIDLPPLVRTLLSRAPSARPSILSTDVRFELKEKRLEVEAKFEEGWDGWGRVVSSLVGGDWSMG